MAAEGNLGPGTLETRIRKLRKKLKPETIQKAEKLVDGMEDDEDFGLIQMAWYLASTKKSALDLKKKADRTEKRLRALREQLKNAKA